MRPAFSGQYLQINRGAYVQVSAITAWTSGDQRVQNLTVADTHTYYVLAGRVRRQYWFTTRMVRVEPKRWKMETGSTLSTVTGLEMTWWTMRLESSPVRRSMFVSE
jgi:hypothetical protein